MSNQVLALCGGGDWYDASVDLLIVPEGRDPKADIKLYPGYPKAQIGMYDWLVNTFDYREPEEHEAIQLMSH